MDYKQVLKVASAKQQAVKEKLPSSSVLLKDLGPPKKEEKSKKGINSPGVRAFLKNLDMSANSKKGQENNKCYQTNADNTSSSLLSSEDLDINNLFKKKKRVALLPDKAILDVMEISNLRKQHLKEKEEARRTAVHAKEARVRMEREKQREVEKAESEKKETLKRVMNILNKDTKQSSAGVKRPNTIINSQPQTKKIKLDVNKPASSFKIPRKDNPKSSAPRPPPMKFDELLKVAEKNYKEQPSDEKVREILSVDLLSTKKKDEKDDKKERPTNQQSVSDINSRPPLKTSSIISNKSNQVKPHVAVSSSLKSNNPQQKCSVPAQSSIAFKKPVLNGNKTPGMSNKPTNSGVTNKIPQASTLSRSASALSKQQQQTFKKPSTDAKLAGCRPGVKGTASNDDKKFAKIDQEVMEKFAESLSSAKKEEFLNLMKMFKDKQSPQSNKVSKNPQKRPMPGPSSANKPVTGNSSRPPETKPSSGWDRAMSALIPKSQKLVHKRKELDTKKNYNDYGDDYDDYDEEEDDMSDFIDDTEEDLDYSAEIKKIFKYDRSKYAEEDDNDLANMESSHCQIEKEEKRSLKIGIKEDLEDMRMEQEELRRKKLKKMGKM